MSSPSYDQTRITSMSYGMPIIVGMQHSLPVLGKVSLKPLLILKLTVNCKKTEVMHIYMHVACMHACKNKFAGSGISFWSFSPNLTFLLPSSVANFLNDVAPWWSAQTLQRSGCYPEEELGSLFLPWIPGSWYLRLFDLVILALTVLGREDNKLSWTPTRGRSERYSRH